MKKYKRLNPTLVINRLSEDLSFKDLAKDAGISNLTKHFKKTRTGLIGSESRNAKLVNVKVDRQQDFVEFAFITEVTPYPNRDFPDDEDHFYGEINPPQKWDIIPNTSEEYDMNLRILDFFMWLDTAPTQITNKDIEDVFKVANIKVSCTCPSWNWQGMAYKLTQLDASLYTQNIPDPVWGPRHKNNNFLCKHLQGLINNIGFFIPQMRQMIIKEVK